MCGRYMLISDEGDVRLRFNVGIYDEFYRPRYNCAPSQLLPVITGDRLQFFSWGLVPAWAGDLKRMPKPVNARCETAEQKPMFREALLHRRCLVPANGYYEWSRNKTPYLISFPGRELFAMAGIWSEYTGAGGQRQGSFAIITTAANKQTSPIHHRMPLILAPDEETAWLDEKVSPASFFTPWQGNELKMLRLSAAVNSVRNDSPELLKPYAETQTDLFSQEENGQ